MAAQPVPVFGHPAFSAQVVAEFSKFFEVAPRLTGSLNDLTGRQFQNPEAHHRVVLNLGLLTGVSAVELVTLAANGMGLGAMKILRTIMESAINAEYIRRNPTECDFYLEWFWVEQNKLLTYVQLHAQHLLPQLTPQEITRVQTEFQRVRPLFLKASGTDLRSSWCSLDLGARAAVTDFAEAFRIINPVSSQLIHGTMLGMSQHFDINKDAHRISVPPTMDYVAQALIGCHMCVLKMTETLATTFQFTPIHSIADLFTDYQYAWTPPAAQAAPAGVAGAPTT